MIRRVLCRAIAGLLACTFLALPGCGEHKGSSGEEMPIDGPRFENTSQEATYIGTKACRACHEMAHATWAATPHSRALRPVVLEDQPLPTHVEHKASGVRYDAVAHEDTIRMEESVDIEGERVVLARHDMDWVCGSGEHSLSYLSDIDGFLVEAPITYYQRPAAWRMSPGFDNADHPGFSRSVGRKCLECHAGRLEGLDGSSHRLVVHEPSIGCERCHGPGSLHAALHESDGYKAGEPDFTIANPARMSRAQRLDVCAQCHLDDTLTVDRQGLSLADWRPGLPLARFRADYRPEGDAKDMTVVGHDDQMRRSKCFQHSEMTCLSCHDPHGRPQPEERAEFFRAKCESCHGEGACGEEHTARHAASNDCVHCHMPRGDTDIPHIAFTHHRVGLHREAPVAPQASLTLVPRSDMSFMTEAEQQRLLGLAYMRLSLRKPTQPGKEFLEPEEYWSCLRSAQAALTKAHKGGQRDAEVASTVAYLQHARAPLLAHKLLLEAMEAPGADEPETRMRTLRMLARSYAAESDVEAAIRTLVELTGIARKAADWEMLAAMYVLNKEPDKGRAAMERALEIDSAKPALHSVAARFYTELGDRKRARRHQRIAKALQEARDAAYR